MMNKTCVGMWCEEVTKVALCMKVEPNSVGGGYKIGNEWDCWHSCAHANLKSAKRWYNGNLNGKWFIMISWCYVMHALPLLSISQWFFVLFKIHTKLGLEILCFSFNAKPASLIFALFLLWKGFLFILF